MNSPMLARTSSGPTIAVPVDGTPSRTQWLARLRGWFARPRAGPIGLEIGAERLHMVQVEGDKIGRAHV